MTWRTITIDDSITRFGQGLVHLFEGDYLLQLSKVEPSPADLNYDEKDPYFRFNFRVDEGPDGIGKTLSYIGMLSPAKQDGSGGSWGLGRVLAALGADPAQLVNKSFPSYEKFAAYAAALSKGLASKKVGGEVADDTYTGRNGTSLISRITGFFPAEEWEMRNKPRTETAASAAPSPRNGRTKAAAESSASPAQPASAASASEEAPADEADLDAAIKALFPQPAAV